MSSAWLFNPRNALLVVLAIVAVFYIVLVVRTALRGVHEGDAANPGPGTIGTGFVTNFFDTLGIGSFATTTSIFRLKVPDSQKKLWCILLAVAATIGAILFAKLSPQAVAAIGPWFVPTIVAVVVGGVLFVYFGAPVDDRVIPGTLNVGHTLPTIVQAFIFTTIVPVDPKTLILLIVASVLGAWVGAGFVARWPRQRIQFGMGVALVTFAALLIMTLTNRGPQGGTLLALSGSKLLLAFAGNLALGALMTLGIGLYAPCMIMIYLLGMDPKAAFPIMMGSCAFLMPVASARFIRERSFNLRTSLGLLIGGIPAVLIAAFIVKSLPLTVMRWLVLVVVLYTAVGLLRASRRRQPDDASVPAGARTAPEAAIP